jgi:hypothetical protein
LEVKVGLTDWRAWPVSEEFPRGAGNSK